MLQTRSSCGCRATPRPTCCRRCACLLLCVYLFVAALADGCRFLLYASSFSCSSCVPSVPVWCAPPCGIDTVCHDCPVAVLSVIAFSPAQVGFAPLFLGSGLSATLVSDGKRAAVVAAAAAAGVKPSSAGLQWSGRPRPQLALDLLAADKVCGFCSFLSVCPQEMVFVCGPLVRVWFRCVACCRQLVAGKLPATHVVIPVTFCSKSLVFIAGPPRVERSAAVALARGGAELAGPRPRCVSNEQPVALPHHCCRAVSLLRDLCAFLIFVGELCEP